MEQLSKDLLVKPGARINLAERDASDTLGIEKDAAAAQLAKNLERLSVLQGIDAGGKDGTIQHVMSGLNPQGVRVTSFKVPEGPEKRHDYLWRVHSAVPEFGQIGIFNRSHYEDVLVVRVHNIVPKSVWGKRYAQINDFERMLGDNGTRVVKFLLYIDKTEQAKRFRERIDDKTKNWKFSPADALAETLG